jgi:hypothetical protein
MNQQAPAWKARFAPREKSLWLLPPFFAFFVIALFACLFISPASTRAFPGGDEVFHGEITDSQCALNVHSVSQSHKEMLAGKSVGTTDADCVWYCVKQRGGRFVLQNKGKVYRLDDQDVQKEFISHKVRIIGTLDPKTATIHVKTIELEE